MTNVKCQMNVTNVKCQMNVTNDKCQMNDKLENSKKYNIYDRALEFAIRVSQTVNRLPKNMSLLEYSRQLIRSSGSVGANIGEADGALSRKDFVNKMGIARREAKESGHWLRLMLETGFIDSGSLLKELEVLFKESVELTLILSRIIKNTQKNAQMIS